MAEVTELDKLRKYMKLKKLSTKISDNKTAALITCEANIYYLTGFANSEGTLFVTREKSYLLVDFRYGEAAQKNVTNCEVIVYEKYGDSLKELAKKHGIKEVMIEASKVTVSRSAVLKRIFSEVECRLVTNDMLDKLLVNQRIVKSKDEIEKIERAQRITEEAYLELLNMVKPGVREKDLALELEFLMRKKGASGVSFDLITITGKKTSMPHGVPGDEIVKTGDFVTFDIGAIYEGYHSDMTRTIAVGEVSDYQREIYNIVLEAQLTGLAKVKAGVKACDVDKAARDVITNKGYGDYYKHSTGHGVGLDIHEQPFVASRSDKILSDGMIITVEPGIYLPDRFGVRIEDMVVVTVDGCINLANLPKELIII
ncbi:MAG: aminopeptidase P family protein [Clostridia bacterium]|nr:aminopeptidase P family protein [Clostridia bacterium]